MVEKNVLETIDKTIKDIWLNDIRGDYGKGMLIREASLQCALYHHLQNRLGSLLEENNLFIYPEFYFAHLKYRADLVIVQMDMSLDTDYLSQRVTDVAAVIELKYDGGVAPTTSDYIKTDVAKLKNYVKNLGYDCQYYFGVIYETECAWLHWFDKRQTNSWASGRVTELNAGYLDEQMCFEVNSYNGMNEQTGKVVCDNISFY